MRGLGQYVADYAMGTDYKCSGTPGSAGFYCEGLNQNVRLTFMALQEAIALASYGRGFPSVAVDGRIGAKTDEALLSIFTVPEFVNAAPYLAVDLGSSSGPEGIASRARYYATALQQLTANCMPGSACLPTQSVPQPHLPSPDYSYANQGTEEGGLEELPSPGAPPTPPPVMPRGVIPQTMPSSRKWLYAGLATVAGAGLIFFLVTTMKSRRRARA